MPDTQYANLRQYLDPNIAALPDPHLKTVLRSANIDADMAEGFFDDFGKAVSSVGRAVAQAAPAIGRVAAQVAPSVLPIAGTVLGTAFGGPLGASLGGTLGSMAGKAIGGATGQGGSPGGAGGGGLGGALSGIAGALTGSPAAGQLLQTLFRPQTIQALSSMAMGAVGRSSIPVGGTQVPLTAFTNLLSTLAGRAEAEYNASVASTQSSVPAYMRDYAGQPKGDPAIDRHRAEALYELLEASEAATESAEAVEYAEYESADSEMEAIQAEYDAIEMAELYEYETEEA
jgi:uncharacterized protein (DUF697 family)